jgi:hypothetical protein
VVAHASTASTSAILKCILVFLRLMVGFFLQASTSSTARSGTSPVCHDQNTQSTITSL